MYVLLLALSIGSPNGQVEVVEIPKASGTVRVMFAVQKDSLAIDVILPDSTYYWGDDFVVSLDVDGSGGTAPGDGDRQWYIRRDADSSVVSMAYGGRWMTPGKEPPRLGSRRAGWGWTLLTSSSSMGWALHLRFARSLLDEGASIAFRTYDDSPHGWWSFPPPPEGQRATVVERTPNLWVPIRQQ